MVPEFARRLRVGHRFGTVGGDPRTTRSMTYPENGNCRGVRPRSAERFARRWRGLSAGSHRARGYAGVRGWWWTLLGGVPGRTSGSKGSRCTSSLPTGAREGLARLRLKSTAQISIACEERSAGVADRRTSPAYVDVNLGVRYRVSGRYSIQGGYLISGSKRDVLYAPVARPGRPAEIMDDVLLLAAIQL